MNRSIRVGLVGYGFAARTFHAPVISSVQGLELAAIVQRSGSSCLNEYPNVKVIKQADELYSDPEIDLVVITTPSTNHYAIAKAALLAGKHVVVEKPFTTTTEEADELISIAEQNKLILSVFHNRRWDGDFLTLQQVIQRNLVGETTEAEFIWDRYSPKANPDRWRDAGAEGSGTLYDLGVHLIDQALTLYGLPDSVQANLKIQREDAQASDYFDVSLSYKSGLSVRLKSTLLAVDPAPRYRLYGKKGSFVKYGEDPQENALKAGGVPGTLNWGEEQESMWGTLHSEMDELYFTGRIKTVPGNYGSYYRNIFETIQGMSELAVKPEQARMAIRVIELARQSYSEQRRIPFTP
ncbi:oxidoreductase [Neobacillus mesonae]|nr:oxidoreductase [Neobacillus mesonae]